MRNLLLSPRMPDSAAGSVFIEMMFGSFFFIIVARMFRHYGFRPELAAGIVLVIVAFLAWMAGFPRLAAVGMGIGGGLVVLGGMWNSMYSTDDIHFPEALMLAFGLVLMLRSYSVGPNPDGWKSTEDDDEIGGTMTGI